MPSFAEATLISGPPASFTRTSVQRFSIESQAEPSDSARTTSVFCETSFSTFGLNDLRNGFAREISAFVMLYGFFAPVAMPAIAIRSVGWFSTTIFFLYFLSISAWYESGFVLTYFGL